jgi:hypothetical protein
MVKILLHRASMHRIGDHATCIDLHLFGPDAVTYRYETMMHADRRTDIDRR